VKVSSQLYHKVCHITSLQLLLLSTINQLLTGHTSCRQHAVPVGTTAEQAAAPARQIFLLLLGALLLQLPLQVLLLLLLLLRQAAHQPAALLMVIISRLQCSHTG